MGEGFHGVPLDETPRVSATAATGASTVGPFAPSDPAPHPAGMPDLPLENPSPATTRQPSDAVNRAFRHDEHFANENERPPSPLHPRAIKSQPAAAAATAHVNAILSPAKPGRERSPEAPKSSSSPRVAAAAAALRPALGPRNVPPPPLFDGRPSISSPTAHPTPPPHLPPAPPPVPAAACPL